MSKQTNNVIEVDRTKESRCTNPVPFCAKCGQRVKERDESYYCKRCKEVCETVEGPCNKLQFIGDLGEGGAIETKCEGCNNLFSMRKL